ncbi:hypothetical protein BJ165DRAFT_1484323 [Panaeolus papilionaceus]|nr:hypothetical protein BJ165DRAFT_1484323 [Panaeolus papilionaceus]
MIGTGDDAQLTAIGVLINPIVIGLYILQSLATLLCDVTITIFLVKRLSGAKSGIKRSDAMVTRLIRNAINRGGLTVVVATVNFILVLAARDSLSFYIPMLLSSKLYMNSALACLNSRDSIKEQYMNGPVTDFGIVISDKPLGPTRSIPEHRPSAAESSKSRFKVTHT